MNMWFFVIYIEKYTGQPLTSFDPAGNCVQSRYVCIAVCLH